MGLTGAGKSTFISVLTGNENIPIGIAGDLDGGTQPRGLNLLLVFKLTLTSLFQTDTYFFSNKGGSRLHTVLQTQLYPLRNPSHRLAWV